MWPFNRKAWEKLGSSWTSTGVSLQLCAYCPTPEMVLPAKDRDYRAIPQEDFEKLLFDCWHPKDYKDFTAEIWDCDNWTLSCMARISERWAKVSKGKEALAYGWISADVEGMGYHAFIWHMDHKGVIRFYEPQSITYRPAPYKFKSIGLVEF